MNPASIRIQKSGIPDSILYQIINNILIEWYLIFYAENSFHLSLTLKHKIFVDVVSYQLSKKVIAQAPFQTLCRALHRNARDKIDYLLQVKETSLIPWEVKHQLMEQILLGYFHSDHTLNFEEENYAEDALAEYDDVIELYENIPELSTDLGREIRIQIHIIRNSQLPFADPETKAELLEELLLQQVGENRIRDFLLIESLYRNTILDEAE